MISSGTWARAAHATALALCAATALWLATVGAACAQDATVTPALDAAELQTLIEMLEDPEEREQFLGRLRTLAQARAAGEAAPEGTAGLLEELSYRIGTLESVLTGQLGGEGLGSIGSWLGHQVESGERRSFWLSLVVEIVLVVAAGVLVRWLARVLLARPRRVIEQHEAPSPWTRIPFLIGHALLDLVPVGAFYGTAVIVLAVAQPEPVARLIILAIVHAVAFTAAANVGARLLLRPMVPSLRLIALADEDAAYAYVWARRLIVIPVWGWFLAAALGGLGLPPAGHGAIIKVVGLIEAALILGLILQIRRNAAGWIRGDGVAVLPGVQVLRNRLADMWHILAIAYLIATYAVWALEMEGGFGFIARATALTVLILVAARLVLLLVRRTMARLFTIGAALAERFPNLRSRTDAYVGGVRRVAQGAIFLVAALLIAEAWSISVFDWLGSDIGRGLLLGALEIAIVVVIAVIVWETASGIITRYLEGHTPPDGERIERSARARTLLPLVKNVLLVVIATIASLSVLSSLGIDIGPLLAGAGVVGLAAGFGAQTLVKDVITGAFILFEDQVKVGDVAIINDQGGLVEKLTVRTIVLRDLAGNVHIVPFSSVGSLTNMTKEYSRYVLDVGVAYREDTDEVVDVLNEIDAEMRADPEFGPKIIAPIEVLGVDRFEDSAVIVRARLTTKPIEQWSVGREFNRRLKKAFDARGIEIPFPHQTVFFGIDKQGMAPAARISVESQEAAELPSLNPKTDVRS